MTNELKEPGWTPAEIPGLVRKKGKKPEPPPVRGAAVPKAEAPAAAPVENVTSPLPTVPPQDPPPAEAAPVAEANGAIATAKSMARQSIDDRVAFKEATAYMDTSKAHEELMLCLANVKTLVQRVQAAADAYYIMCDYLSQADSQPYIPVVDSIMRALHCKDPQLVPELIEGQANEIVCGWLEIADAANKAVDICQQLTQVSRTQAIDEELREAALANG